MKKYIAEFIGTFGIVFLGTGAIILHNETGQVSHLGISFAFGFSVFLVVELFGKISGGHFNPAVTIPFAMNGYFSKKDVLPYLFFQISGAVSASLILKFLFPTNDLLGTTLPSGNVWESFFIEILLMFLLMMAILLQSKLFRKRILLSGFIIGSVVFLEAYFAGPITGASMNPARSIGPAMVSTHLEHLWVYILAPLLGAVLAIFVFKLTTSKT